jgi:hypothetical protein
MNIKASDISRVLLKYMYSLEYIFSGRRSV